MHLCWQPAPHAASEVAAVAVSRSRRCTSHEHSRCPVKAPKPKLVAPRTPGYSPVRNEASEDMGRADQGKGLPGGCHAKHAWQRGRGLHPAADD